MRQAPGAAAVLRRAAASIVLAAVVVGTVGPATMTGGGPAPASVDDASGQAASLSSLHVAKVAGAGARIVDESGRTVLLRGVNLAGLEDDFYGGTPPAYPVDPAAYVRACPADVLSDGEPPVCEVDAGTGRYAPPTSAASQNDLAQIRSLGFDVVRLTLSWSLLEPTPGVYDTTYLDRIAQVVGWAHEQGVYVILDMHQDAYSRFVPGAAPLDVPPVLAPAAPSADHADGAPAWAVVTDGAPNEAVGGQAELDAAVAAGFTSFWLNRVPSDATGAPLPEGAAPGPGLQDHYIGAMAALATRFAHNPTVAGYEIMNEPLPGVLAPALFDQGYLYPFYRRVIDALTGAGDGIVCPPGTSYVAACGYRDLGIGDRQLLFFEPMAARNLTDVAVGLSAPFSSYPNLVYAPHVCTHVFTVDTEVPGGLASSVFPLGYGQAFTTAGAEAQLLHAALFVGEYGTGNGDDATDLAPETAALDDAAVGSALWEWKANCGAAPSATDCWSLYYGPGASGAENGPLIATRVSLLSRIVPRATAGTLVSFGYDPTGHRFAMSATDDTTVPPGASGRETVVLVPAPVAALLGAGWAPVVSGAAVLDRVVTEPDGSARVLVAPTGAGAYRVSVGPAG